MSMKSSKSFVVEGKYVNASGNAGRTITSIEGTAIRYETDFGRIGAGHCCLATFRQWAVSGKHPDGTEWSAPKTVRGPLGTKWAAPKPEKVSTGRGRPKKPASVDTAEKAPA